ncbi:hypothetical protein AWC38_SpisGene17723 [Stylophora pistillata]|uniref:Uncharacterized protein n=1 Tax=Stylophora pistillata TaxID=50429 RepID=A0A2B4RL82_STYPI|nr:hypothetical protein AWC38_SpisGene17723 [Stylophora pistillata]
MAITPNTYAKSHTVRDTPTQKLVERFVNGWVRELYERSIYERYLTSEPSIEEYQAKPAISNELSHIMFTCKHNRVFRGDRETSRISEATLKRLRRKGRKLKEFVYERIRPNVPKSSWLRRCVKVRRVTKNVCKLNTKRYGKRLYENSSLNKYLLSMICPKLLMFVELKANALLEMELSHISKDPREAASSAKTSSSSSHLEEELEQMGSLSILKEGEPLLEPAVEGPDVPGDRKCYYLWFGLEPEDVDAIPDAKSKRIQAKKIEENLDKILCLGSFDAIKEEVTPKTLYCCESNTLLKAFQVTEKLRDLAHEGNPEKDDIEKLEKSLNEFTSTLIDPLKTNAYYKRRLSSDFDHVIDIAIDTKQKKVLYKI